MASPQLEKGYFNFANEIAEALAHTNLSAYETRVLWAIWRKTYGYHKSSDRISLQQFHDLTGLPISNISHTINRLERRNIILVSGRNPGGRHNITTYQFQKDYELWDKTLSDETVLKETVSKETLNSVSTDNKTVFLHTDTKYSKHNTKDNENFKNRGNGHQDNVVYRFVN